MIASYTAIISLEEAKNSLRIDDTLTEDDSLINSMITAAFQYIEKYTNHILVEQDREYFSDTETKWCGQNIFNVYDFPIVNVVSPASVDDYTAKQFPTKTRYTASDETITLNLGYAAVSDIPSAFIQAAYTIINTWYYNSEKMDSSTLIPSSVRFSIDPYRRFPLF